MEALNSPIKSPAAAAGVNQADRKLCGRLIASFSMTISGCSLFIGSISGIGALTRAVFGVMRESPEVRKIIFDTAKEIVAIANVKGVGLTLQDVEMTINVIDSLDFNTTASMQRDIMEGKPSELQNFNGYIVAQGKELGIETPTNAFIYHCLMPQEVKARS